jgi:predicted dehydrogenase
MRKIHWGVLSTAKIGLDAVLPAMQRGQYSQVIGIASRGLEKAQAAASRLGIPKAYASYEELLEAPDIEAVYNPLPNHLHVPWSIKALEAGKHVLCEKPIGMDVADARRLLETSKQYPTLKVMEAFMYRYHPQWRLAQQLVRDGEIGELRSIHTFFNYYLVDPTAIYNILEMGGGALRDIGCYAISLSRLIFDSAPEQVFAAIDIDPQFKIDRLTAGILDFGRGICTFTCSTQLFDLQRVTIMGTHGQVEFELPFNPPIDRPAKIILQTANRIREIELDICDQYTLQGDLFSKAILDNMPVPTPLEDAVANMVVIDALFQSAQNQTWVKIS